MGGFSIVVVLLTEKFQQVVLFKLDSLLKENTQHYAKHDGGQEISNKNHSTDCIIKEPSIAGMPKNRIYAICDQCMSGFLIG